MRKLNLLLVSLLIFGLMSCGDDEEVPPPEDPADDIDLSTLTVKSNVTSDQTWKSGKVYKLADRISVTNGATLTIEPGTIIKGEAGTGSNATALVVATDGKIMAEGEPENPIIFTTVADEIEQGQVESPNLSPNQNGFWGGVVLLGSAPISARAETIQFEGIPASDETGQYGGSDPSHNAGTLKYVSIRHGGANIGEGNEINGLTLAGCGKETTVENVEVVANQDDGIECFGGNAEVKNTVVWNQADDAYDMDQAFKGTIDNFIAIEGSQSDHGLELDGPEGSKTGLYTLQNGSLKGYNEDGTNSNEYADLRDDAACVLKNLYFFNYGQTSDFEFDEKEICENYTSGSGDERVELSSLEFNVDHLSDGNTTIDEIFVYDGEGSDCFEEKEPNASIVSSPSVGANPEPMQWTWAGKAGELSDF